MGIKGCNNEKEEIRWCRKKKQRCESEEEGLFPKEPVKSHVSLDSSLSTSWVSFLSLCRGGERLFLGSSGHEKAPWCAIKHNRNESR